MTDRIMARAQHAASALVPFMGIVVIIIAGKRW